MQNGLRELSARTWALRSSLAPVPWRRARLQQRAEGYGKEIIDRCTARGELHGTCHPGPALDKEPRGCISIDRGRDASVSLTFTNGPGNECRPSTDLPAQICLQKGCRVGDFVDELGDQATIFEADLFVS